MTDFLPKLGKGCSKNPRKIGAQRRRLLIIRAILAKIGAHFWAEIGHFSNNLYGRFRGSYCAAPFEGGDGNWAETITLSHSESSRVR